MLAYEILSWLLLGLALAVGRCMVVGDPERVARILVGSALAAACIGIVARLSIARSVAAFEEYSGPALLAAGLGAMAFLVADWMWQREKLHPRS